jgi:hypothetical protein
MDRPALPNILSQPVDIAIMIHDQPWTFEARNLAASAASSP